MSMPWKTPYEQIRGEQPQLLEFVGRERSESSCTFGDTRCLGCRPSVFLGWRTLLGNIIVGTSKGVTRKEAGVVKMLRAEPQNGHWACYGLHTPAMPLATLCCEGRTCQRPTERSRFRGARQGVHAEEGVLGREGFRGVREDCWSKGRLAKQWVVPSTRSTSRPAVRECRMRCWRRARARSGSVRQVRISRSTTGHPRGPGDEVSQAQ